MDPKGKVALLTGGARIGRIVAEALARKGALAALAYRASKDAAEKTAQNIRDAGGEARIFQADLASADEIKSLVRQVGDAFGRLDILINMASVWKAESLEELTPESWERNMGANARAAYLASIEAARWMKRSGGGRIVNFSDWTVASGRPRYKGFLPYYASKSAVHGLTESLALELAPDILVNTIAPGPILAPSDLSKQEREEVERATPVGRWGGPEEIAKTVLFLVETDFVTGECIRVDGGRHLS